MLRERVVVLALILGVSACGSSSNPDAMDSHSPDAAEVGDVVETFVERRLVVEISGEHEIDVDDSVEMRFVVREGEGETAPFSIAHAGFAQPLDLDGAERLDIEVGVVGLYRGSGTYTLPAGIGPAPTTGPTVAAESTGTESISVVGVRLIDADNDPPEIRFGYLAEPCEIELSDAALAGEVRCPELVAVNGTRVSLTMSWAPPPN